MTDRQRERERERERGKSEGRGEREGTALKPSNCLAYGSEK